MPACVCARAPRSITIFSEFYSFSSVDCMRMKFQWNPFFFFLWRRIPSTEYTCGQFRLSRFNLFAISTMRKRCSAHLHQCFVISIPFWQLAVTKWSYSCFCRSPEPQTEPIICYFLFISYSGRRLVRMPCTHVRIVRVPTEQTINIDL